MQRDEDETMNDAQWANSLGLSNKVIYKNGVARDSHAVKYIS